MKVATFQMSDDIKIFCPFCGKLAFDAQAEELSEEATCPHMLFHGYTGMEDFIFVRDDIATDDHRNINSKFMKDLEGEDSADQGDDDEEDQALVFEQVQKAEFPESVCFEIEEPFCPPMGGNGDSVYLGFSLLENVEDSED